MSVLKRILFALLFAITPVATFAESLRIEITWDNDSPLSLAWTTPSGWYRGSTFTSPMCDFGSPEIQRSPQPGFGPIVITLDPIPADTIIMYAATGYCAWVGGGEWRTQIPPANLTIRRYLNGAQLFPDRQVTVAQNNKADPLSYSENPTYKIIDVYTHSEWWDISPSGS